MRIFANFFQRNQWPVLLLSFLTGWTAFYLKLTSLQKLVDSLSLEAFPVLMIGQGILLLLLHSSFKKLQKKFSGMINVAVFIVSLLLVLTAQSSYFANLGKMEKVLISCFYFLASTLLVTWMESALSSVRAKFVNALKYPFQVEQNSFSFEIGIFGGALAFLIVNSVSMLTSVHSLLQAVMIGAGVCCLLVLEVAHIYLLRQGTRVQENGVTEESKSILSPTGYPFVPFLMGLVFILLASKHLQNLAVLLGMLDLKEKSGVDVGIVFAKITIFQNLLIVGLQLFTFSHRARVKERPWSAGIKIFLGLQIVSMIVLVVKGQPWALIGTGVVRKLTQHWTVNPALFQFERGMPQKLARALKDHHEQWAMGAGFIFVGLYSTLTIYGPVPHIILWFCGIALALAGFWCRKMLFEKFNEFQITNMLNLDMFSGAEAANLLADREAAKHANAIINLLEQDPPPMMARGLAQSLGRMQGPRAMAALMSAFHRYNDEDVKVVMAKALLRFDSLEVDLFFRKEIRAHLSEQVRPPFWTGELFYVYADRMEREVFASLLEMIASNRDNHGALSVYLHLFGQLIKHKKRPELASYLAPYLEEPFPRKVHAAAIVSLFYHRQFAQKARESFESFLTSPNIEDRMLVCDIVCELMLKDFIPFVLNVAQDLDFKNYPVLLALLKLGEPRAPQWLVTCLAQLPEKEVTRALWALSSHPQASIRFLVYEQIAASRDNGLEWTFSMLKGAPGVSDFDLYTLWSEVSRQKQLCLPPGTDEEEKITQERLVA
ncbi:MAG: hypothetical protein A2X86_18645 [Bdellovibrionales bacterium GWA2_49_15]|nr:MAG: hypothetical protein A2X86_18645 [Bdellovibrionales bacterium GWA2_49_15]HAZ14246.1 hypothetical protein [Bdellovibrionales bacterium]